MHESISYRTTVIMLSIADVSKTFKQVNIHKAAGPDGLTGCVLNWQVSSLTFQPLPARVCNTYMFQADHHSSCAQETEGNLPK